jgi:hypothetical protein
MPRYFRGDVVEVWFPYEDDPYEMKSRRAVVLVADHIDDVYLLCKITTKQPKKESDTFRKVEMSSADGIQMNLTDTSYVVYNKTARIL